MTDDSTGGVPDSGAAVSGGPVGGAVVGGPVPASGQSLDDYWVGDFTVRQEDLAATGPGRRGPLPVERLASPDITVRGRGLGALLAPVYRALTS
jgi:hypothetical protein